MIYFYEFFLLFHLTVFVVVVVVVFSSVIFEKNEDLNLIKNHELEKYNPNEWESPDLEKIEQGPLKIFSTKRNRCHDSVNAFKIQIKKHVAK